MSKPNLTEKQTAVYKCIVKALANGLPPTVREICYETGIKSTSTVHGILSTLEQNGYITRGSGSSRDIRIEGAPETSQIPVLGKVTAGVPILAVEDIEGYIPFPTNNNDGLFALNVSGYSMKNAGILDGDIIIADKYKAPQNGDIVVGMVEEEATVKRLGFENGKPVLFPENEDFSPIRADYIEILGTVVGSFRRY